MVQLIREKKESRNTIQKDMEELEKWGGLDSMILVCSFQLWIFYESMKTVSEAPSFKENVKQYEQVKQELVIFSH